MSDWFETMEDQFWLHPDEVGEREAHFVLKALHLRRGDAVLDAPCGAGRVSFHLARAGCVVTGLDLREAFIRRVRLRLRTAGLHGTFRALDLRRLNAENQFEGILNWAGSFGYFTAAENSQLIAAFVRALRPGGYLLVEQPNREHLLRHLRPVMRKNTTVFHSRWDGQSQRVITPRSFNKHKRHLFHRSGRKRSNFLLERDDGIRNGALAGRLRGIHLRTGTAGNGASRTMRISGPRESPV